MPDRISRKDFLKFSGLSGVILGLGRHNVLNAKRISDSSLKIDTWGDSITAANEFQPAMANELNIPVENIANHGISSDFSQHIRKRFVDYYTANPEKINNFQIIFLGTNNLRSYYKRNPVWTTKSTEFTAKQSNYDERYDLIFTQSYQDQMLRDIQLILDLIPHKRYLIVPGHISSSALSDMDNFKAMVEFDNLLLKLFPLNAINLRHETMEAWNYLDTKLSANFIKPALNSTVTITVSETGWMENPNVNGSSKIAIGTKQRYDIYQIINVQTETKVQVKLIESNLPFDTNEIVRYKYNLVSDLGRDEVIMHLGVYSYDDIVSFGNKEIPGSMTRSEGVHPTHEGYQLIGKIFAREIEKILS